MNNIPASAQQPLVGPEWSEAQLLRTSKRTYLCNTQGQVCTLQGLLGSMHLENEIQQQPSQRQLQFQQAPKESILVGRQINVGKPGYYSREAQHAGAFTFLTEPEAYDKAT